MLKADLLWKLPIIGTLLGSLFLVGCKFEGKSENQVQSEVSAENVEASSNLMLPKQAVRFITVADDLIKVIAEQDSDKLAQIAQAIEIKPIEARIIQQKILVKYQLKVLTPVPLVRLDLDVIVGLEHPQYKNPASVEVLIPTSYDLTSNITLLNSSVVPGLSNKNQLDLEIVYDLEDLAVNPLTPEFVKEVELEQFKFNNLLTIVRLLVLADGTVINPFVKPEPVPEPEENNTNIPLQDDSTPLPTDPNAEPNQPGSTPNSDPQPSGNPDSDKPSVNPTPDSNPSAAPKPDSNPSSDPKPNSEPNLNPNPTKPDSSPTTNPPKNP